MQRRMNKYGALVFAGVLALAGCSGEKGANGADGTNGTNGTNGINGTNAPVEVPTAQIEACAACHPDSGSRHNDLFQTWTKGLDPTKNDLKASIVSIASTANTDGTFKSTLTFTVTRKDDTPVDLYGLQQKTMYATEFNPTTKAFVTATNFSWSLAKATPTGNNGEYKVTNAAAKFAPEASANAFVYGYFGDQLLVAAKGHYNLMANVVSVAKVYGAVDYTSTANVSGCEKCHAAPYSKHGYRQASVSGLNDFVACKACHTTSRAGTDFDWQVMADDAPTYATLSASGTATVDWTTGAGLTTANKYKYTANVMNDTHMSHSMEFGYPQSMANCVTCHEGKLGAILTDANFALTTCKSCHPITGTGAESTRAPALKAILTANATLQTYHGSLDLYTTTVSCNGCHNATNTMGAPTFAQIHSGTNSQIYAANGTKYLDATKVTIDSATYDNKAYSLEVKFSATKVADVGLDVTKIVPTLVMSLYGYDTKDFIVSGHGKDSTGARLLEFPIDGKTTNPRFTVVTAPAGSWDVKVDLSMWKDMIGDGSVKRVEIGVIPTLKNAAGVVVPVQAPNRTFDLTVSAFRDGFFSKIVDEAKCNKCHDALGTTFHTPDRGNVVLCRICHTTATGAGHLELQSRSIDSYVHAIHSSEPFGTADVDFADPVQALRYNLKREETYPQFTLLSCESCHVSGSYEVPENGRSLPTVLSAAATLKNGTRAIVGTPEVVTGPGSRACGSCHRAAAITEDSADALQLVNDHVTNFGYIVPTNGNTAGTFDAVVKKIMSAF